MSEGTTRTPNGVSGEMKVQGKDDVRCDYTFATIEFNMENIISKDGVNGSTSASGAAAKGGSDIAMVIGAEAKTPFINPGMDAINLVYDDPEKVDKSKFDDSVREEEDTKSADDNIRN